MLVYVCTCGERICEVLCKIFHLQESWYKERESERDRRKMSVCMCVCERERACVMSSLKMGDLVKQRFIMDIIIAHTNYLK